MVLPPVSDTGAVLVTGPSSGIGEQLARVNPFAELRLVEVDVAATVIVPAAPNRVAAPLCRLAPRWLLLPMLARSHPGRTGT